MAGSRVTSLPPVQRRLLTYGQAAAYLGISKRQAEELAKEEHITKVHIGASVRFDVRDLDRFIDDLKAAG